MRANLHIHSRFSDGKQWPEQIVRRAKGIGLELIAITDHDNTTGNQEFLEACRKNQIKGLAGIEIDCKANFKIHGESSAYEEYRSEVLGYFPNENYNKTESLLEPVLNQRKDKFQLYLKNAQKIFDSPDITWEDFLTYHLGGHIKAKNNYRRDFPFTFMKPHLYNYLVDKKIKVFSNLQFPDFKKLYFGQDPELNLEQGWKEPSSKLKFEEVIKTVHADGGYTVIPHLALRFIPKEHRKNRTALIQDLEKKKNIYDSFLDFCRDLRVWGIELYYYKDWEKDPAMIKRLNSYLFELAKAKGFNFTWGSDCHGVGSHTNTLDKAMEDFIPSNATITLEPFIK